MSGGGGAAGAVRSQAEPGNEGMSGGGGAADAGRSQAEPGNEEDGFPPGNEETGDVSETSMGVAAVLLN